MKVPSKIVPATLAAVFTAFCAPCSALAKQISVFAVYASAEAARDSNFYAKSGNDYKMLAGDCQSISKKSVSVQTDGDEIKIFQKTDDGYVPAGSAVVPDGIKKYGLVILPKTARHEFTAKIFDADFSKFRLGTINIVNLTDKTLRGKISNKDVSVVVPENEALEFFKVPSGEKSADLEIRLISAAKTKEQAKKTWRYGNCLHLATEEALILVVTGTGAVRSNGRAVNEVLLFRKNK